MSRPDATPIVGSSNMRTSAFTECGWMRIEASVLTTISPRSDEAAAFSAAVFPARCATR
jgi:hypothetical protein